MQYTAQITQKLRDRIADKQDKKDETPEHV